MLLLLVLLLHGGEGRCSLCGASGAAALLGAGELLHDVEAKVMKCLPRAVSAELVHYLKGLDVCDIRVRSREQVEGVSD